MSVVVVAGGLGDMGRLITEAIYETGKYEVYVMSRSVREDHPLRASPITGKPYLPIIQTDYQSEGEVAELLTQHNVHTVICTFSLDFQAASDSQLKLIRAAERSPCVKRFIPSEFNVDYDQEDDTLPYPDKRFHTIARRELEMTNLEFTYIYPGMFMDYFGMPKISTHLRELCLFVDPTNGVAMVPGDGEAKMSMSYTKDVARYTALAIGLDQWPRVMTTASSTISVNELVGLVNKSLGFYLKVTYQSVSAMRENPENGILPRNAPLAEHFPGGAKQLGELLADLGASVALGAYDFSKLEGHLDLVKHFAETAPAPMLIEELVDFAWGRKSRDTESKV